MSEILQSQEGVLIHPEDALTALKESGVDLSHWGNGKAISEPSFVLSLRFEQVELRMVNGELILYVRKAAPSVTVNINGFLKRLAEDYRPGEEDPGSAKLFSHTWGIMLERDEDPRYATVKWLRDKLGLDQAKYDLEMPDLPEQLEPVETRRYPGIKKVVFIMHRSVSLVKQGLHEERYIVIDDHREAHLSWIPSHGHF
jgi:hypothetical protein